MTTAASDPMPPGPVQPRRSRRGLFLVLLLVGVSMAGGVGWYVWRSMGKVEPPAVELAAADPEVAAAIESARDEVRRSPRSAAAWGKLGKVLAAHRYLEAAGACFTEAGRLQPDEVRWPYFRGLTLAFSDSDAAVAQFQHAVQLGGDAPAVRLRLAEALEAQGRLDEAEEQFRHLLDDRALGPRAQLGLARLAYRRGDLQIARNYLGTSAAHPLTRRAAHTLLAEIEQRSNDPAAAAGERARAAELPPDPDWSDPFLDEINRTKAGKDARLSYAVQLLGQQRTGEAVDLLRELLGKYPDWDQAWLTYGRVLLENQAYPPAEEALRKAVQLAPDSVGGHFNLGLALFQRGEYREAATHFRQATRLKPDHALAWYNLGHCLKRENDRPGAVAAFREAVRCKPNMAAAHTNLGEQLLEQGDKAAAVEELRLGLELNPEDATAKKLLEQLGQGK
jgi:tetratricopeptide (TPR) repeat protein